MLYIRAVILGMANVIGCTDHMMYVGQVQILSVIKVLSMAALRRICYTEALGVN